MIIYVPEDIMARLESQLHAVPEKIPDVLRKTINSAAVKGRKSIVKNVRENYVLKKVPKIIKESSEYESARGKNLQATIVIKGSPTPIEKFQTRKNGKRVAVKAKVLRNSTLKQLTEKNDGETLKAFVQKIKVKTPGGGEKAIDAVLQRFSKAEIKQRGMQRNAAKRIYSIPVSKIVENEKVLSKVEKDIKEEMRKSLERHIATVMEGL